MPVPSCPRAELLAAADLALVLAQPLGHAVDRDGQVADLVVAATEGHGGEVALAMAAAWWPNRRMGRTKRRPSAAVTSTTAATARGPGHQGRIGRCRTAADQRSCEYSTSSEPEGAGSMAVIGTRWTRYARSASSTTGLVSSPAGSARLSIRANRPARRLSASGSRPELGLPRRGRSARPGQAAHGSSTGLLKGYLASFNSLTTRRRFSSCPWRALAAPR